jgi:hypothetical protein
VNNLPDNWNSYYSRCAICGQRYHASGTDECACVKCESCSKWRAPDDMPGDRCATCCDAAEEG